MYGFWSFIALIVSIMGLAHYHNLPTLFVILLSGITLVIIFKYLTLWYNEAYYNLFCMPHKEEHAFHTVYNTNSYKPSGEWYSRQDSSVDEVKSIKKSITKSTNVLENSVVSLNEKPISYTKAVTAVYIPPKKAKKYDVSSSTAILIPNKKTLNETEKNINEAIINAINANEMEPSTRYSLLNSVFHVDVISKFNIVIYIDETLLHLDKVDVKMLNKDLIVKNIKEAMKSEQTVVTFEKKETPSLLTYYLGD